MIIKSEIKAKLSKAIKASEISQTQIAKELGVSVQTVWRYANGQRLPRLDILSKLCAVLNLDANEIFCLK